MLVLKVQFLVMIFIAYLFADIPDLLNDIDQRTFLLMPFMHSESKQIHEVAVQLFREYTPENNYEFELKHKAIVDRFGRYPHRNAILGRQSTDEESEFLKEPGSGF